MNKAVLVHGWDGTPDSGWFPWLSQELKAKGFEVIVPQLPETEAPRINNWVPALAQAIGAVDEHTYFVGHSMGCQVIVRYLETLPEGVTVGGAIFVAGFFRPLTNLETDEEKEIGREWTETPINFAKVSSHLGRSVALFSDNDPWVPVENAEDYKNKLGSETIVLPNQSHFNGDAGFKELPIVLEKLLQLAA
jgi:predicted alpha/beta hydrolase family esterase